MEDPKKTSFDWTFYPEKKSGKAIKMKQFTEQERASLMVEVLLMEITPDQPEKIESVWDLLSYLYEERLKVIKMIMAKGFNNSFLIGQLQEIKADTNILEDFLQAQFKK